MKKSSLGYCIFYLKSLILQPINGKKCMTNFIKQNEKIIFRLLYILLTFLYLYVAYTSFGFDDEFFNMDIIERYNFIPMLNKVEHWDVHPPGQYMINYLLYSVFHNWRIVRLFGAILMITSIIYSIENVKKSKGVIEAYKLYFFLGANPALLLWCTGIRWYSYFIPILIWLCIIPNTNNHRYYWSKCFFGLLILAYINYAAFIVAVPVLYLYWSNFRKSGNWNKKNILILVAICSLAYLPQLYFFIKVHSLNRAGQIFSLKTSIIGFVATQLSNQGVFPISNIGVLAILSSLFFIIVSSIYILKTKKIENKYIVPYWILVTLLIITGLAGKLRNFILVSPFQSFYLSCFKSNKNFNKLLNFSLIIIAITNIIGIYNVTMHQDTTKNSWNLPIKEVLAYVENIKKKDGNQEIIILTHDPILTRTLIEKRYRVISPYNNQEKFNSSINKNNDIIVIKTFMGSINENTYKKLLASVDKLKYDSKFYLNIGIDRYFLHKRKINKNYPKWQMQIIQLKNTRNIEAVKIWNEKLYEYP